MEKKKYKIQDFKTMSKEGRISEALVMIANEIHELKIEYAKTTISQYLHRSKQGTGLETNAGNDRYSS